MKRLLGIVLAFAAAAALGAPVPSDVGLRALAFLQTGRDLHVIKTGFFLDGGSKYATLADTVGATIDVMILNKRRAQREGAIFGVYEPVHHHEYFPTGADQAAFKAALRAALRRSKVSNPDTRRLLRALTSWFPTYADDIHWSASRAGAAEDAAGPLISPARATLLGGVAVVLAAALGFSVRRRAAHTPVSTST